MRNWLWRRRHQPLVYTPLLTPEQVEERSERYGRYLLLPVTLAVPEPYVGEPSTALKYRVEIYNPERLGTSAPWLFGTLTADSPEKAMARAMQMVSDEEARFMPARRP